jgi:uncharacterized integral membrane protein
MMNLKIFAILLLIIVAAIFVTQNVTVVDVNLLFWPQKISLALLIIISLLLGFLLGWFIKSYLNYKKSKASKSLEKENSKPENSDL